MKIAAKLDRIRTREKVSIKHSVFHIVLVIILGLLAGIAAKFFDLLPYQTVWTEFLSYFFMGIGEVGSMFSFWICTTTLIAVFSRSPLFAGIHSFCYLFSMNIAYYIYQSQYYGLDYSRQFVFWTIFSVLSIVLGAVIWYAKGSTWISALLLAFPLSVFMAESYVVLPNIVFEWVRGTFLYSVTSLTIFLFCILCIFLLLFLCQRGYKRRLQAVGFGLLLSILVYLFMDAWVY